MKKLLFLLFLCVFFSNMTLGSSPECNIDSYSMELSHSSRKIILKGKGVKQGEVTRVPVVYPVEAFIDNNVLYLNFFSEVQNVTVTVIDLDTNEIVLQDAFSCDMGLIFFDLVLKSGKDYLLELSFEKYNLIGYI